MMRPHDDATAGLIPGVTAFLDGLANWIHTNELFAYPVVALFHAVLCSVAPVGLPALGAGNAQAAYVQQVAPEAGTLYAMGGLGGREQPVPAAVARDDPGPAPLRTPSPLTVRQLHSGHSLTDTLFEGTFPGLLRNLTIAGSGGAVDATLANTIIEKSTIPGSPTRWRWEQNSTARTKIGDYELLSITDGGPPPPPYTDDENQENQLREDVQYLRLFAQNARLNGNGGAGAETMLYTIWPSQPTSRDRPHREMLDELERAWHYRQDMLNLQENQFGRHVFILPGHRMMMRIYDDFAAGLTPPSFKAYESLFRDDIHASDLGRYAIACLAYAVIYQRSPVGLPHTDLTETPIPSDFALYVQTIAWEIATTYARAGLGGTDMGLEGRRPEPPLESPAVTLGASALAVVDPRSGLSTSIDGTGADAPAAVGDPVGRVDSVNGLVLRALADAQRPTLGDGFITFDGSTMLTGPLDAPAGERYMMALIRVPAWSGPQEVPTMLAMRSAGLYDPRVALMQNEYSGGLYVETVPAAGDSLGRNVIRDRWELYEWHIGADETWFRAEGLMRATAPRTGGVPATVALDLGSILNGAGPLAPGARYDLAALVIASERPTDEQRWRLRHWAWSRLGASAP